MVIHTHARVYRSLVGCTLIAVVCCIGNQRGLAQGAQLWTARYSGPHADVAQAVTVDSHGNVCVTGASFGNSSNQDIATVKYSSLGAKLWVKRYNGPGNGHDEGRAIA